MKFLPSAAGLRRYFCAIAVMALCGGLVLLTTMRATDSPVSPDTPVNATAPISATAPVRADAPTKADGPTKTEAPTKADAPTRADGPPKTEATAQAAPSTKEDCKIIDRKNFTLKYPTGWKEATDDPDYNAESHFTINGPGKKNSYVTFEIVDKTDDTTKLLGSTIQNLDGSAIEAETKTTLDAWGQFKGTGMDLKGKILDTYPGGIKVFIFSSDHHNIIVTECYWSAELKDLQADLDYIRQNFVMKN